MKKEFKKWICIGMSLATIMTMQPDNKLSTCRIN